MEKNRYDIHERIYKFALSVLQAVRLLPKTTENGEIIAILSKIIINAKKN